MPQTSAIYGVARIRSHEKDVFSRERLMRLIDGTAEDVVRQLTDAGYGDMPDATVDNASRMIDASLKNACELVKEVSFRPEGTDVFLMKADVHNLKLLLKLRLTGSREEPALMRGGLYEPEKLEAMVRDADYRDLPEQFREALAALEQSFQTKVDPVAVSVALDRAYILYAYGCKDGFVREYFRTLADFDNVLALLRVRAMDAGAERLRAVLLPAGAIDHARLLAALDMPLDGLGKSLATGPARDGILRGLETVAHTGRISALERERDDALMRMASAGRMEDESILPVVSYLLAREQEAICVRLILTAKRNGLPDAIITERLRELYV